jgi:hypothetical protein
MQFYLEGGDDMEVSDGYHTLDELYDHRIRLYIATCRLLHRIYTRYQVQYDGVAPWEQPVWRSKLHADGSAYDGWFILGIFRESGKQISYHLPLSVWEATDFAETLELAPEWDGHTSVDVLERLKTL